MKITNSVFSDLPKRVGSAVILGVFSFAALKIGGLTCAIFLSLCFFILIWEVFYICSNAKMVFFELTSLFPALLSLVPILQFYDFYPVLVLSSFAVLSLIFKLGRVTRGFCIVYIGVSIMLLQGLLLSNVKPAPINHVLFLVLLVMASDVGGYIFGRMIGGPRILVRVSPKKTWAGSFGGLTLAIIASICFEPWLDYQKNELLLISMLVALSAQAGDLLQSAIKRSFNIKDSGFLMPGHGGLFDRLDGLIFAVPIYVLITTIY